MPRFETDPDIRALGEALASLRRDRGLSQAEAGRRAGMTSQGWGLYESGRRPGLFRPDVQRRLVAALDASPEDLALARSRQQDAPEQATPAAGLEARGRTFQPDQGGVRRLQLSNDDLAPWAASGVVLEYNPEQWPRRDQGCVIETVDGTLLVRLYDGADSQTLTVRGGAGGLGAATRIARSDVRTVSAVTARLER
ncbi:helix-turn-helix transcriptional regulator [Brevundimonas sp.]|uniref:helix-turn-helix domain-containing protein n=1 Tax=Brevundimonas sp. TaxID=1871086 RepID=UPI002ABC30B5|nr:helix-turn-helix transcriptional regulator [Brevundimonas sp.]MDZ4363109.1 helix-turn-helix transcriptional regulator [Brevundimonas sp.]